MDDKTPLRSIGALSGHTRPIDCLAFDESTGRLYTGDSMGIIRIWCCHVSYKRCNPDALDQEFGGLQRSLELCADADSRIKSTPYRSK